MTDPKLSQTRDADERGEREEPETRLDPEVLKDLTPDSDSARQVVAGARCEYQSF